MRTEQEKAIDPVLIDMPLPIVTPRLLLRPPQQGDGLGMHEAKEETWDMLVRWMPWTTEGLGTPETAEVFARKAHAAFLLREKCMLIGFERASGRPVVWTGFHDPNWKTRQFTTGYWVRESAQGKGYATEAGNAVLRYLFGALKATRVQIGHAAGNDASRRVIEKLGYAPEAVMVKAHELPDGRIVDGYGYARLSPDGLPPLDVHW